MLVGVSSKRLNALSTVVDHITATVVDIIVFPVMEFELAMSTLKVYVKESDLFVVCSTDTNFLENLVKTRQTKAIYQSHTSFFIIP